MRPTWNWLLAASLTYITWEHYDTHPHTHSWIDNAWCWFLTHQREFMCMHSDTHTYDNLLKLVCRSPINPFDSYLFVLDITRMSHVFFHLIYPPLLLWCLLPRHSVHTAAGDLCAAVNSKCYLRNTHFVAVFFFPFCDLLHSLITNQLTAWCKHDVVWKATVLYSLKLKFELIKVAEFYSCT